MTTHLMKLGKLKKRRNFVFKSARQIDEILIDLKYPRFKVPQPRLGTNVTYQDMYKWCNEMIGENNWLRSGDYLYFSNESCLSMFMLRWSE